MEKTMELVKTVRRPILAALYCVLAAAAPACHRDETPKNVVFISVDTMRADRVGLYGYPRRATPNLDRFFGKDGRVYLRSWSTEASTTPSIVSMLTGQTPQQHRVRMLLQLVPSELRLLPEMLPDQWQTAGFVSNMMLTTEASGLGRHFDYYDDFVDERERYRSDTFERNAAHTTDAVLTWLDTRQSKVEDAKKSLFLWVHYMDPHGPYHPPDDWPRTFHHKLPIPIDIERVPAYEREPGVTDGLAYVDAYDEEIAYTDSAIGRLLDGIDARLGLERTLVVFTADHGESMMDHESWFRHAVQVYEEMVRIPLMLRGPGVHAGRSDLPTSGLDITPTILSALGLPVTAPMPDIDLRSGKGLATDRIVYTEASLSARDGDQQWRAAIQNNMKWVIGVRPGNCRATLRRYDLARDPDELTIKTWTEDSEPPRSLLGLCESDPDPAGVPKAWAFGAGLKSPKSAPMNGEDQMRSLKALGYAE